MPIPTSRLALLTLGLLATTSLVAARRKADERQHSDLETIPALDVERYLGDWYEIAKFPNRFEKQCDRDTTAHYSLLPGGAVQVTNRCRADNGRVSEVTGVARQLGGPSSPRLEVRFAPGWLSFLPMVWGDYWVIDIDAGYELAAVSEPGREYLWILARTPTVSRQAYGALLDRLERKGFDVDRLQKTRHTA